MTTAAPTVEQYDSEIAAYQQQLLDIEAEFARRSLRVFIEHAWAVVEPSTRFVPNWHIDVLCEVLEQVTRGELKRVIINVPPGTMKTLLISVFWPAWEWATNPGLRYLTVSYTASRTVDANLKLRDIITSEWYRRYFGLELSSDQNAKERFDTTAEGWRIASSVGGIGTGVHPDRIILDDPMSADQARSDKERKSINKWVERTLSSRGVTRDVATVVDMQRLHEDDTTGFLLAKGGWELVCFPMRYETERKNEPNWKPDPRDPRRETGALLWPALFTEEKVRQLELDLGPYGTAGQLQQRPAPEGGGLFKREWFKFVSALPHNTTRCCRGWDTAGTEGDGDYSSGTKIWETEDDRVIIENVVRDQVGPDGLDQLMLQTAQLDGHGVPIREGKEPAAAGKAVVKARSKLLKGYDYRAEPTNGDKVTRAKPFRAQCEAGNVYLLRTGDTSRDSWIEPFIAELTSFPTGANDDQVDSTSTAYNQMLLEEPLLTSVTPFRRRG